MAKLTWTRPQGVQDIEQRQDGFAEFKRSGERPVIVPEREANRELAREPGDVEWASGQQVALRLAEMGDGRLDALDDLVLIVD